MSGLNRELAGVAGVKEVRGMGLMMGIELDRPCAEVVKRGLAAADFRSMEDLARLPLTRKDDYMRDPDAFRLADPSLPEEMRTVWDVMYTTGSSTGRPTPFISTSFDFFRILELKQI